MQQLNKKSFKQNISKNSNNQENYSYLFSQNTNGQIKNGNEMIIQFKEIREINKDNSENKLNTNTQLSQISQMNCINVSNERKLDDNNSFCNQIDQNLIEQGDIQSVNEEINKQNFEINLINEDFTQHKNKKHEVKVQNQPKLNTNNLIISNGMDIEINMIGQKNFENMNQDEIEKSFQINQADINCITLYKNEKQNIKVEYLIKSDQNILLIKKSNQNGKIQNEYEQKILEKIKNERITLDFIDQIQNGQNNCNSYQQISGKTDLYCLKQKNINRYIFEVYFLVLLGKLNKMHALGIAHSDIKPQNIVISYENEPFFIDFDCSIFISDYSLYLVGNTYKYNLNIYYEKQYRNNKIENVAIKFKNEEEVKLCDKTQLAITFLYLFCENQEQLNLFQNKEFNQLLNSQFEITPKTKRDNYSFINQNKLYTLYIINCILNEADSNIQLIGSNCLQSFIFVVDFEIINDQLKKTNDIQFCQTKNVYKVKRIDKLNVKLLYLMDKLDLHLEIIPSEVEITPQSWTKEYTYIFQKYLRRYCNLLMKNENQIYQNYFNLSKQIKILSGTKQTQFIYFRKDEDIKLIYESIQNSVYSDNFVIHFVIKYEITFKEDFLNFIQDMTNYLPDFYISRFEDYDSSENKIFKLNRIKNNNITINIKLSYYQFINFHKEPKMYIEYIQKYIKSKEIYFTLQFSYQDNDFTHNTDLKQFSQRCLINLVNQILGDASLTYKFSYPLQIQKTHNQELQKFNKSENIKFISQTFCTNTYEQNILLYSDKYFDYDYINLCQKGETMIMKALKDQQKDINQIQQIILKFNDFFFIRENMWKELKEILKNENNKLNKLILINCIFSKEVVEVLQDIKYTYKQVKYEYYDDYIEPQNDKKYCIDDEIKQRYSFSIQYCSDKSSEQGLVIQFFKYYSFKKNEQNQQSDYVENEQNKKEKKIIQMIETKNKNKQQKNLINFIQPQNFFKSMFFTKFKIPKLYSQVLQNIQIQNKIAIDISNIKDINFINQEINKNIHYQRIQIDFEKIKFAYHNKQSLERKHIKKIRFNKISHNISIKFKQYKILKELKYQSEQSYSTIDLKQNQQINELNKIEELYNSILAKYISSKMKYFNLSISQKKYYKSFQIKELFFLEESRTWYDQFKNINDSFCQIINNSQKFMFILQYYLEDGDFENENISNEINEDELIDGFDDFLSDYSIQNLNIMSLTLQKFLQKDYFLRFNFDKIFLKNLFQFIERKFKQQKKWYKIKNCLNTQQQLFDIYEIIKDNKDQCTIFFDFKESDLSYFEFKQFIKKILIENTHHEFIFEINSYNKEIMQFIKNEFESYKLYKTYKSSSVLNKFIFRICFFQHNFVKLYQIEKKTKRNYFYVIHLTNIASNKIKKFIKMLNSCDQINFEQCVQISEPKTKKQRSKEDRKDLIKIKCLV